MDRMPVRCSAVFMLRYLAQLVGQACLNRLRNASRRAPRATPSDPANTLPRTAITGINVTTSVTMRRANLRSAHVVHAACCLRRSLRTREGVRAANSRETAGCPRCCATSTSTPCRAVFGQCSAAGKGQIWATVPATSSAPPSQSKHSMIPRLRAKKTLPN